MNTRLVLLLAVFLSIGIPSVFAEFDSESMGLQTPDITVSPLSGPPGTEVTITIKNAHPVPQGLDPRIEFFAYVPFVTALGDNVANNCNGEHCFPIYSFEEINEDKLAPKTIRFSLFSTDNTKATIQGGFQESVCDVRVNEKTIERYGTVCTDKDQPVGNYDIKFAWGIQGSDNFDVTKTITFTVTEKGTAIVEEEQDSDEKLMDLYDKGQITEQEFDEGMKKLGFNEEAIRKSKALIGKLPHQQGEYSPEQKEAIEEGIEKAEQRAKENREDAQEPETQDFIGKDTVEPQAQPVQTSEESKPVPKSGCLIATATYGTELAPQVQILREVRDNVLFSTNSGTTFMVQFNEFYYAFSPSVADLERQNPVFREAVKYTITPMLSSLSILQLADSESQVLGYGIGVILLNVGMYFVAPAIILVKVKKYLKA